MLLLQNPILNESAEFSVLEEKRSLNVSPCSYELHKRMHGLETPWERTWPLLYPGGTTSWHQSLQELDQNFSLVLKGMKF